MESMREVCPVISLLVVEDDKDAIEVICSLIPLKFPDITIYVALNGSQGEQLFKEHVPDIVITDINMPGMDGIRMVRNIKAVKAGTRFIVLSGYSDKIHRDIFNHIGISDYILKPTEFNKLFAAIAKCIAEIKQERQCENTNE